MAAELPARRPVTDSNPRRGSTLVAMEIRTERIVLREFVAADWEAVLHYQRDPRYLRLYPWHDRTEDDVRSFVRMLVDHQSEQPRRKFQLAITLPESGELIGNCGVRLKDGSDLEADCGYELSPRYWGLGYATEAARAMVDFGFRELGVHRLSATVNAENTASSRVLERLGFELEGRLRENERFKGRWWDTLVYAMLDGEWRAGWHVAPARRSPYRTDAT